MTYGMQLDLQRRCALWVQETFGDKSLFDKRNRAARFAEEAAELAQVEGVDLAQMIRIVERVYSRPPGVRTQEIAGSLFTFLVYLYAAGFAHDEAIEMVEEELGRCHENGTAHYRAKQLEKFKAGTDLVAPIA